MLRVSLATVAVLLTISGPAPATTFTFDTPPFNGIDVGRIPGRQIVGGEAFLGSFDLAHDIFSMNGGAYGVAGPVSFANGLAAQLLPGISVNVVVLQDSDDDNNPLTPFGAGNAANLIASRITQSGPGFFVYMNSDLNLRRLVYSTNLSSNTADLQILARILNPLGEAAIQTLPRFSAANFEITTPTPEPGTVPLIGAGLLMGSVFLRRYRNRQ